MNIIYVHSGNFPSDSPSITFTSNTVNSLAEEAKKCYFYVKMNSNQTPQEIFSSTLKMSKSANLVIKPIKVLLNKNYNSIYFLQVYLDILKIAKHATIDAIITRNVTFLPKLVALKKKFKCKVFLETHDFFTDLTLRTDINIAKKLQQQKLEQKFIPQLDGLFCLTHTQRELYAKYYPKIDIFLARTGLTILPTSSLHQRKYLGYVGSLDTHKGVMNLIKIAALTKTQPDIIIIGAKSPQEQEHFLQEVAKIYDISKIKLLIWQNKEDLNKLLDEIKIGFVTLTDTYFNNYLTSPLKIFDYLSKLIPVIGSKLPTIEEVINDNVNGFLYEIGKEEEIAAKIDLLMSDDKLYATFMENIRTQNQTLTWRERAKKMIAAINSTEENTLPTN